MGSGENERSIEEMNYNYSASPGEEKGEKVDDIALKLRERVRMMMYLNDFDVNLLAERSAKKGCTQI